MKITDLIQELTAERNLADAALKLLIESDEYDSFLFGLCGALLELHTNFVV